MRVRACIHPRCIWLCPAARFNYCFWQWRCATVFAALRLIKRRNLPDYQVACPKLQNRLCWVIRRMVYLSSKPLPICLPVRAIWPLTLVLRSLRVLLGLVHCLSHISSLCGFSASPRLPGLLWLAWPSSLASWMPGCMVVYLAGLAGWLAAWQVCCLAGLLPA